MRSPPDRPAEILADEDENGFLSLRMGKDFRYEIMIGFLDIDLDFERWMSLSELANIEIQSYTLSSSERGYDWQIDQEGALVAQRIASCLEVEAARIRAVYLPFGPPPLPGKPHFS